MNRLIPNYLNNIGISHNYQLIIVMFVLCIACSYQCATDEEQGVTVSTPDVRHFLINQRGDAVRTGITMPARGNLFEAKNSPPPHLVPFHGAPVRIPQSPAVRVRADAVTIQVQGLHLPDIKHPIQPDTFPAEGKVNAVLLPEPTPARPLLIKHNATLDVQYLDVTQGLLSSYIRTTVEDSRGFLWFGTSYGLSRYDGTQFIHFTTSEGLNNNAVLFIEEDRNGHLWLGTNNGVTHYDGQHFTHYLSSESLAPLPFRAILADTRGELWLGAQNGLYRLLSDGDQKYFIRYTTKEGLPNNNILTITEDSQGRIWVGTAGGGACRLEVADQQLIFNHLTTREGLPNDHVSSILEDENGNIWLATNGGLCRFRPEGENSGEIRNFGMEDGLINLKIWHIIEDHQGQFWFGSAGGLTRFDGERFVHYNTGDGLTSNVVRFLLEDSHDNIWLGTGGGGMNRINPDGFQHLILDHFTPDNDVSAISKDRNGNIWMGTNDGLYRYNDTAFLYYNREQGLPTSEIGVVLVDSRGHIWLGTKKGAIRMEPKNRRFVHFTGEQGLMNNNVKAIVEDRLGRIWLGTDSGLSCFSNNGFINYSIDNGLINDDIQVLLLDLEGHLWIGSKGGVSCLQFDDPTAEKIIHYSTGEQPAGNSVISLLQDRKGNIWVGTEGQGLSRFQYGSPQPDFIRYTIQDGLSNNTIWSLEEDRDGNIWMGTERGITVMVMPEEQCYTFRQEEGLKRLDFQVGSILLDDRNRMWWGTRGGVKLDLDQFELPSRQAQPVQLTHIDINNDYIDFKRLSDPAYQQIFRFGRQLSAAFDSVPAFANYPVNPTLPYSLNQLTFHFSAVNVPSREKVRYRYFLEGADDTWTYSKQNFSVPYRNLDPGWYSFKVQTTDETSKWSPPVSYDFRIRPPWWKTAWAYATYVLLGLAALYLGYRLSQHQLRLQHALDRRKAETQHLKELDTVKNRLYTNLTHAFRTPLTIILGMTDHVQQHVDEPLSEPLRLIRRNGQELLGLINRLLDLSKIEDKTFQLHLQQGDIVSFLRYLTNAFHTYAAGKGLKLGFSSDMDHLIMDYDPAQVQQVMSNLLSNAIKFTPSGGNIRVQLSQKEDLLQIEVVDTGIGIAPQEYTKIFDRFYQANSLQDHQRIGTGIGLAHARELVHLMDGTIEVSSERGLGTTFTVDLPIRNNSAIPHAESPLVLEVMPEFSQYYGEATSNDTKTSPIPVPEQMESSEQPLLLIIEDHTEVASYLRVCLQDNYQLEFAADGQEGIDKALRQIPDIIISDVMMPKKNGYEVCEAVKHDERTSHIPIILLTAKADTDSRLEGLSTGADAYLAKPFHQKELQIRLENMLENRQKIRDYFARKFEQGITIQPSSLATVSTLPPMEDAFLERIRKIVEANYDDENFSLPQLCQEIGMSRSQLYRKMKALIDTSPSDFIRTYRLEKARELLASEELNVSEAAWRTGFKDVAHFSKLFLDAFGYSPSQEKN